MSERITVHPDICNGKPVIRGTRITAQTVLEFLAAGDSVEDMLEEYPTLTREDASALDDTVEKAGFCTLTPIAFDPAPQDERPGFVHH